MYTSSESEVVHGFLDRIRDIVGRVLQLAFAGFLGYTTFYDIRDTVSDHRRWLTAFLVFVLVGIAVS